MARLSLSHSRTCVVSSLLTAGMLIARLGWAGDGSALAESLFEQGRELMESGQTEQACEKFSESQRLDPGLGTLLNLALCNEKRGRIATAWAQFREALSQAAYGGIPQRESLAREHAQLLEPRLPKLEIVVPAASRLPGLEVTVDGTPLREAAWGMPSPVDPGTRMLRAVAPGRVAWEQTIALREGDRVRIDLPVLAPTSERATQDESPSSPGATQRALGWTAIGLGAVSLGAGAYFGVRALSLNADSKSLCPTSTTCTENGAQLSGDADSAATAANWTIGAGMVIAGTGIVLLWTSPDSDGAKSRIVASPMAQGATISWQGVW